MNTGTIVFLTILIIAVSAVIGGMAYQNYKTNKTVQDNATLQLLKSKV